MRLYGDLTFLKNFARVVFTNVPSISPQSDLFGWNIFRFVLFCQHANKLSSRKLSCTSETGTAKGRVCG